MVQVESYTINAYAEDNTLLSSAKLGGVATSYTVTGIAYNSSPRIRGCYSPPAVNDF